MASELRNTVLEESRSDVSLLSVDHRTAGNLVLPLPVLGSVTVCRMMLCEDTGTTLLL